ncbi:MAG: hypothetical protein ACRDEA_15110 [Microcystaceae cyanobacterium]
MKDLTKLTQGAVALDQVIRQYWKYFLPESKALLERGAIQLEEAFRHPIKSLTLAKLIRFIKVLPRHIWQFLKTGENPALPLARACQNVAKSILELAHQDAEDMIDLQDAYTALERVKKEGTISWEQLQAELDL